MAFGIVKCSLCNREYLKDTRHINENIKLKSNFYCSPSCFSKAKNKQRILICENPLCNNRFKRSLTAISFRNFCSSKCALVIIGPENGLKNKKYRYCKYCGAALKSKKIYCSMKCWGKTHELSKEELIEGLQCLSAQLHRSPTKREFKHRGSCLKQFGSWNNALVAAGLEPNRSLNQRMYKRRSCFAEDGHQCYSVSEMIIDNWLHKNKITHSKESPYPVGKFKADWSLSESILVEYFGLANDSKRYDKEIQKKQLICKEYGIKLIEIYSIDLFPKHRLDIIFHQFKISARQPSHL